MAVRALFVKADRPASSLFVRTSCVRDVRKNRGSSRRGAEYRYLYLVGTRISCFTCLHLLGYSAKVTVWEPHVLEHRAHWAQDSFHHCAIAWPSETDARLASCSSTFHVVLSISIDLGVSLLPGKPCGKTFRRPSVTWRERLDSERE